MKTILFVMSLGISQIASAHGEHPKPIASCASKCTQGEIEKSIPAAVGSLILRGTLGSEWAKAKVVKVELKTFSKGPEWVATIYDEKIKDKTKQNAFVFITTTGFLNGANFTGN